MKLLEAATVERGDGRWSQGFYSSAPRSGAYSNVSDICLPNGEQVLSGYRNGTATGYKTAIGAVVISGINSTRCSLTDLLESITESIPGELDKALGQTLWYGTGQSDVWLGHEDVATVATNADPVIALASALQRYHTMAIASPGDAIAHMGLQMSLSLADKLADFDYPVKVVTNPMYPVNGLAVTGPIAINVGSPEILEVSKWNTNRIDRAATQLFSLSFDPASAVVIGAKPLQAYLSSAGLTVTVFLYGHTSTATVVWGDATANSTIASNADSAQHTYATAGTYNATVGGRPLTIVVE